ncbi:MAG TPA: hypothetical protein VIV12_06580, partial [Streptosporangiaceae bacterium]
MRKQRPNPTTPLGRLMADLQTLRKSEGLTRAKVARARELCGLPVVRVEAERLGRSPEEVAYHLVIAAVHGLNDPAARDYLITALVLDNTPPGDGLTDRRRRYVLDESRVRDHEDEALEEVARWLLEMTNPEVLFGDYLSEATSPPPPEWNANTLIAPVHADEVHPREEVVWDFLEKTSILNERGVGIATETRGIVRAMVDGATGYTVHHTPRSGSLPKGIGVCRGGKPGRIHPPDVLGTRGININFHEPLRLHRTLQIHWLIDLKPAAKAEPVRGYAEVIEVQTRNLTLRAQFHDEYLPVAPRYLIGWPHLLPESIGPPRPLKLQP